MSELVVGILGVLSPVILGAVLFGIIGGGTGMIAGAILGGVVVVILGGLWLLLSAGR